MLTTVGAGIRPGVGTGSVPAVLPMFTTTAAGAAAVAVVVIVVVGSRSALVMSALSAILGMVTADATVVAGEVIHSLMVGILVARFTPEEGLLVRAVGAGGSVGSIAESFLCA